jgi:hypothetical protein
MANKDIPSGAIVAGRLGGGTEVSYRKFSVDASNAVALFHGAMAILSTDGNADGIEAASDDFVGIITGIFDADDVPVKTLAASTAGSVVVCDDPEAIYNIQFEGGGTAPTSAAIGDCADFIWTHAGNANTGRSGMELSETLAGDGNSAQMRILGLVETPDNSWGHNAQVLVTPNEHAFKAATVAI